MHLQNVSLSEARNFFFRHMDSIIFTEREICSLQSLLADYKRIISDYGNLVGNVKSSYGMDDRWVNGKTVKSKLLELQARCNY